MMSDEYGVYLTSQKETLYIQNMSLNILRLECIKNIWSRVLYVNFDLSNSQCYCSEYQSSHSISGRLTISYPI